jgi:hypothetical protein
MAEGGSGRVAAVRQLIESLGGTLESMHFAFGSADWYVTVDLPTALPAPEHRRLAAPRRSRRIRPCEKARGVLPQVDLRDRAAPIPVRTAIAVAAWRRLR